MHVCACVRVCVFVCKCLCMCECVCCINYTRELKPTVLYQFLQAFRSFVPSIVIFLS